MDKDQLRYDDGSLSAAVLQRLEKRDHDMQMAGFATGRLRLSFNAEGMTPEQKLEQENEQQRNLRMIRRAFGTSFEDRTQSLSHNITLAEAASYEALIEAQEMRDFAFAALKKLQANAHMHPDGRRVYLSEDGSYAIDENFNRLADDDKAKIEWHPGKPTAEDYEAGYKATQNAQAEVQNIEAYRQKIDNINNDIHDGNIMDNDQLEAAEDEFLQMPDTVKSHYQDLGGKAFHYEDTPSAMTAPGTTQVQQRSISR